MHSPNRLFLGRRPPTGPSTLTSTPTSRHRPSHRHTPCTPTSTRDPYPAERLVPSSVDTHTGGWVSGTKPVLRPFKPRQEPVYVRTPLLNPPPVPGGRWHRRGSLVFVPSYPSDWNGKREKSPLGPLLLSNSSPRTPTQSLVTQRY